MKTFAVVMGAMFVMSAGACGKKAEGEAAKTGEAAKPAEGGAGGDLPATCKKYLDTAKACFAKAGEAGKAAEGAFNQVAKGWEDAAKAGGAAALEAGCKQAWDMGKQSYGAMCPDVKWE